MRQSYKQSLLPTTNTRNLEKLLDERLLRTFFWLADNCTDSDYIWTCDHDMDFSQRGRSDQSDFDSDLRTYLGSYPAYHTSTRNVWLDSHGCTSIAQHDSPTTIEQYPLDFSRRSILWARIPKISGVMFLHRCYFAILICLFAIPITQTNIVNPDALVLSLSDWTVTQLFLFNYKS